MKKICESLEYWLKTPSRVEKFEDATCQLHIPCNKNLILIVKQDGILHT